MQQQLLRFLFSAANLIYFHYRCHLVCRCSAVAYWCRTRPVAAAAAVCASREQEALLQLGGIEFLGFFSTDWLFFLVHCVHVVAVGSCGVSVNPKGPQTVTCALLLYQQSPACLWLALTLTSVINSQWKLLPSSCPCERRGLLSFFPTLN